MSLTTPSRRRLVAGGGLALGGLMLSGCDRLSRAPTFQALIGRAQEVTMKVQRLALARQPLAREFTLKDLSPVFKANGTTRPTSPEYLAAEADDFASWRLAIGGLVARTFSLSLAQIKALPARTQITRHDCVEGWSGIAQWHGARLGSLLERAGLKPQARYIAFFCADTLELTLDGSGDYYETIAIADAFHPQTSWPTR